MREEHGWLLFSVRGWGIAVVSGLTVVHSLFQIFPVDFIGALGQLSSPVLAGLPCFQYWLSRINSVGKKGVFSAAIVLLTRQLVELGYVLPKDFQLLPEAGELFVGTLLLIIFALIQDRNAKEGNEVEEGESIRRTDETHS